MQMGESMQPKTNLPTNAITVNLAHTLDGPSSVCMHPMQNLLICRKYCEIQTILYMYSIACVQFSNQQAVVEQQAAQREYDHLHAMQKAKLSQRAQTFSSSEQRETSLTVGYSNQISVMVKDSNIDSCRLFLIKEKMFNYYQ